MSKYPIYYSGSPNFGDAINPVLYKHITGEDCNLVSPDYSGKIIACGSLIHLAQPHDILWGTGSLSDSMLLKCNVTTQVLALRGPLTAGLIYQQTGNSTDLYCDPGLLLSHYIHPSIEKTQEVGIIPHYTDRDNINSPYLIDVMSGVDNVISHINMCKYVVSSCLHGIVCAESYGIPAVWVEFSDNVFGGGFKFRDYYLGTKRKPPKPLDFRNKIDLQMAKAVSESWEPPSFDLDLMLSVCPFTR